MIIRDFADLLAVYSDRSGKAKVSAGGADFDLVFAALNEPVGHVHVVVGKGAAIQLEANFLLSPGLRNTFS